MVTHSALGLRQLFEKFRAGVTADVIKNALKEKLVRPRLIASYEAGETVLKLSNTTTVKPGDVLQLRVPVVAQEKESPKFSLVQELKATDSLSADPETSAVANGKTNLETDNSTSQSQSSPSSNAQHLSLLAWQQEVDAIAHKLHEIRSIQTYQVQVEAVLDSRQVQIVPTWSDIPSGAEISKRRTNWEVPEANFVQHLGLDWQVLVGEQLISYCEYKKRVVLQQKGMDLDADGEIVVAGMRLRDTMPAAAYEIFLKGLQTELATAEVEVPHTDVSARPDKAKLEMQAHYGTKVKGLIQDLFKQRNLIWDGTSGRSLVERPVKLLAQAITKVQEKGHEPNFANNSALIHGAVFGFVKEQTGRGWSEHTSSCRVSRGNQFGATISVAVTGAATMAFLALSSKWLSYKGYIYSTSEAQAESLRY